MAPNNMNDAELAQQLQDEEQQLLCDWHMAQSIADSVHGDGQIVGQEVQIARDQALARRLAEATEDALPDLEAAGSEWDDEMLARAMQQDADTEDILAHVRGGEDLVFEEEEDEERKGSCAACGDEKHVNELATAPCDHTYCGDCLSHLFSESMRDETLFPPRCCRQPIPVAHAKHFLGPELALRFQEKAVELSTVNRTYCHDPVCATFIPPNTIVAGEDVATCPRCAKKTCTLCKAARHRGECPRDEAFAQLAETARQEGWRRCRCGRFIELTFGCNHMTCQCGYEFCYVCEVRWKGCRCPQWAEARPLINTVSQGGVWVARFDGEVPPPRHAVDVQAPPQHHIAAPQPQQQAGRQQRGAGAAGRNGVNANVEGVMAHLRQNHACTHPSRWRRFKGYHLCEVCHKQKKDTVGECKHCYLVACYYCRRHRL